MKAVINNKESNMNYQNIATKIVDDKKRLGLSETIAKQLQRLADNNSLNALDKMQAEITVDWYYPLYK
jgi:hypothetical protein